MKLKLLKAAQTDVANAIAYYNAQELGVFYSLKNDIVIVIAVLHSHREPRAWQAREG